MSGKRYREFSPKPSNKLLKNEHFHGCKYSFFHLSNMHSISRDMHHLAHYIGGKQKELQVLERTLNFVKRCFHWWI